MRYSFFRRLCCGSSEIPKKFLYKNINNLERINDPNNQCEIST